MKRQTCRRFSADFKAKLADDGFYESIMKLYKLDDGGINNGGPFYSMKKV